MRSAVVLRFPVAVCVVALAGLLAVNMGVAFGRQAGTENPRHFHAALRDVPAKELARRNPMEGEADSVAAGGKLYEEHCAECHGKKAEGTRRAPSLLRHDVQQATPGAIFWVLTNGVVRRGMPVWSKLPEPQRWQIVTFLKSFQAGESGNQGSN